MFLPVAAVAGSVLAYSFFSGGFKHSHAHAEAKQVTVQTIEPPKRQGPMISKVEILPQVEEVEIIAEIAEPVLEPKSLVLEVEDVDEPVFAEPVPELLEPVLETKAFEPEPTLEVIETILLEQAEAPMIEAELPQLEEIVEAEPVAEPVAAPTVAIAEVIKAVAPPKSSAEATFEQYRQAMLHTGPRDLEKQARVEMQSKGGVGNSALWRAQTASLRKSLGTDDAADFLERANISVNDRVISSFNAYRHA
jgi:hypothetical protein